MNKVRKNETNYSKIRVSGFWVSFPKNQEFLFLDNILLNKRKNLYF